MFHLDTKQNTLGIYLTKIPPNYSIISMFCCPLSHQPEHSMQYCRWQRAQLIKSPTAFSHATQTSNCFLFFPRVFFPRVFFPRVFFPRVFFPRVFFPPVFFPRVFFLPVASFISWIPDYPGMRSFAAAVVTICPGFGQFVFLPRLFFSWCRCSVFT